MASAWLLNGSGWYRSVLVLEGVVDKEFEAWVFEGIMA